MKLQTRNNIGNNHVENPKNALLSVQWQWSNINMDWISGIGMLWGMYVQVTFYIQKIELSIRLDRSDWAVDNKSIDAVCLLFLLFGQILIDKSESLGDFTALYIAKCIGKFISWQLCTYYITHRNVRDRATIIFLSRKISKKLNIPQIIRGKKLKLF